MKTLLVVVFSVIFASCLCSVVEGASATIPLLAWSNAKILSTQNEQYLETITAEDIERTLYSLLGVGSDKGFISTSGTPESVVLFVEPQLQTDQIPQFGAAYATSNEDGSFSALKRLVHTSQSSFVAPYATAGLSFSLLDNLLERIASKVPIVLVRQQGSTLFRELSRNDNVRTSSVDSLKVTKGKTELIVVCFDKAADEEELAAHDKLIDTVSTLVSAATSGNFVGMYTGNSAPSSLLWTFPNPNAAFYALSQFGELDFLYNNATNVTNTTTTQFDTYFTGPILEAFMVSIALLTMILVGVCNICSLQVPEQYENPKQQKQM